MRVSVVTIGCKVNQFESQALEEALLARGHEVVAFGALCDAVVVNSCTVTHRSDRDARALVRRARKAAPEARIVVTGCYAQVDPEALRELGVDAVVGNGEKQAIPELLERGTAADPPDGRVLPRGPLEAAPVKRFSGRSRAFLKVQEGCEAFCAYCIVPYARGPSRSLPLGAVSAGLRQLAEGGHREVVLTGVHLGLWGRDLNPPEAFSTLLAAAEASGVARIRLSSLEPREVTPELLDRLAGSPSLCPHLHVPLQSGSDRILAAMGRPYRAAEFAAVVQAAVESVPGICLGLDVIAGFPGEDEAAFRETEELLAGLPIAYLHVFPFSPRRGTRAWSLADRVPEPIIRERAERLRELSRGKREGFYRSQLGSVQMALPEGKPRGGRLRLTTRNYVPVHLEWNGRTCEDEVPVELVALEPDGVTGTLLA